MKHLALPFALVAAVALAVADPSSALEAKIDVPATPKADVPAAVGGMHSTPTSKQGVAERRKAVAKIKPVDINSATAAELKKLPGIGDAEAARIIAGRPYGSKLWLVTKNIIPQGYYLNIKNQIVAVQPYKDMDKNAAVYQKKP